MNIDEIVGQMGTNELRSVLVGEQELVKEGGNMFSDVTRINQENVAATLKYIYQELLPNLDIDRKNVQPLGSVGKKLPGGSSGDLDLGIDATKCDFLQDSDNLVKDLYEHCKPVLDDMGIECKMIPTLFSIRCPIQNFDGKQEGEFVQLDMMVTKNMKFQTWSNYADKEKEGEVYIKGAIRNLIFEAASHAMDKKKIIKTGYFKDGKEFVEGPIEWEEYSFFTAEGLNIKHVTLLPMTKQPKDAPGLIYKRTQGKDTDVRTLVSNDPDVIAKKMFGPKVKGKDLMTWKGAWDAAHNSAWAKDPEQWKIFLDSLREKIQVKMSAGFNIPDVMLDELELNNEQINESSEDDSAVDAHRHSLIKIYQLSGNKLRTFLSSLVSSFSNGDVSLNVKTTPKIDGNAFRIGWYDGRVYVENSGSGVVDASGEEIETFQKPQQRVASHLLTQGTDKIFSKIESLGLSGVKVTGELLVNGDDLMDDDGTITYVGTTYNARKLGSIGSIVLFQAQEMDNKSLNNIDQDKQQDFIEFLCSEVSDAKFSYFNLEKFAQSIELTPSEIPAIKDYIGKPDSFTKMKKDQLESIRDQVNEQLTQIYKTKFKNPDIMVDDGILEGVVFSIGDNMYGINYQDWKDKKHQNTSDIEAIREFPKQFLSQVTGIAPSMPFLKLLNAIRANPDKYQDKYRELLPTMLKKRDEILSTLNDRTDLPRFLKDFAKERGAALMDKFADGALTDDVMSLVELIDGKSEDMKGGIVALVPGSFRPPHKGHFEMIKHYASIADKVVVGISKQTNISAQRFDKYGRQLKSEQVKEIFEIYLNASGLTNVELDITPKPMQWIGYRLHHLSNCKVILGVSSKDDTSRFESFTTEKFLETIPSVEILDLKENSFDSETMGGGEPISATFVRDNIDNRDVIRKVLPSELNDVQFEEVFDILNSEEVKTEPKKMNEEGNEELDSNERVAVIITDGEKCIVGKSPQMMRKEFNCCDLMKGHAQMGESLEEAAKREAMEECGLNLTNLTKLTGALKYSKGTTLTFFKSEMNPLPNVKSLQCQSFYEYNGRQFPEIAQYLVVPLEELPQYLYKGLAKLVVDNGIVEMIKGDDNMVEEEPNLMMEGGHAPCDTLNDEQIARINQENVAATIEDINNKLLPELGLTPEDAFPVGSTGKKLAGGSSGDIDLAIDQKKLMEVKGIETPEEFVDFAHEIADKLNLHKSIADKYGWKAASYFWPIANVDGKQDGQFVQLDLVVTPNTRFTKWGMFSDQEKELKDGETDADVNPKSGVRNGLFQAIAMGGHREITKQDDNGEDIEMIRYDYTFNEGLFKVTRVRMPKKNGGYSDWKVANKEFVSDDPDTIVRFLYNDESLNADDIMTAKDAWDALIDSGMLNDEETRNEIERCFLGVQKRHRWDIPSWMKFD